MFDHDLIHATTAVASNVETSRVTSGVRQGDRPGRKRATIHAASTPSHATVLRSRPMMWIRSSVMNADRSGQPYPCHP